MILLNSEGTHRDDGNRECIKMAGTNPSQFLVKLDMNKEYQKHKQALCMLNLLKDIGFEWDLAFCKFQIYLYILRSSLFQSKEKRFKHAV